MALKCCSVAGTPLTTIDLGPLRLSEAEVLASAAMLGAMATPADLERITDELDRAYAIMAYSKSGAMLVAVRVLLGKIRGDDMPTQATRAQWTQIAETMLRLGSDAVTSDEIRGLGLEIHHLREAIMQHLARIAY